MIKSKDSVLIVEDSKREELKTYDCTFEIWGVHGVNEDVEEFLISDEYNVDSVFYTLQEALEETLKIPETAYEELEEINIEVCFSEYDGFGGYEEVSRLLLLRVWGRDQFEAMEG